MSWEARIANMGPLLNEAEQAIGRAQELSGQAGETLLSLEKGHRSLSHALGVTSQDLRNLPASELLRRASADLSLSADNLARLSATVKEQHERVKGLHKGFTTIRSNYDYAHASANTLANRTTKALLLLVRSHPYRLFLAVSDGACLIVILVGAAIFILASALKPSEPAQPLNVFGV